MGIQTDRTFSTVLSPQRPGESNVKQSALLERVRTILWESSYESLPISIGALLKKFKENCSFSCKVSFYGETAARLLKDQESDLVSIGVFFDEEMPEEHFFSILSQLPVASLAEKSEGNLRFGEILQAPEYSFYRSFSRAVLY